MSSPSLCSDRMHCCRLYSSCGTAAEAVTFEKRFRRGLINVWAETTVPSSQYLLFTYKNYFYLTVGFREQLHRCVRLLNVFVFILGRKKQNEWVHTCITDYFNTHLSQALKRVGCAKKFCPGKQQAQGCDKVRVWSNPIPETSWTYCQQCSPRSALFI